VPERDITPIRERSSDDLGPDTIFDLIEQLCSPHAEQVAEAYDVALNVAHELRKAVARHARTLDDIALGKHDGRDRDSIDNELYNAVRATDPAWWDAQVPGLGEWNRA
jgi:hypothetical protein